MIRHSGLTVAAGILACGINTSLASESIYISQLQAYTLGWGKVEFYEAYLVTSSSDAKTIIETLEGLCDDFPRLGTYVLRIFLDPKYATVEGFRKSFGNYPLMPQSVSEEARKSFVAEYSPMKKQIAFFPTVERRSSIRSVQFCAR